MQRTFAPPRQAPGSYSVAVADILRFALPSGTVVAAGREHLGRRVFWARLLGPRPATIAAGEAGEAVLVSVAGAIQRSFARLVADLAESGVCCFVVAGNPPADSLVCADELGVPILQLPDGASPLDAERAIISLIVDRDAQVRRRVEQIYERLIQTLVDDGGVDALIREVAEATGHVAVVLDEYATQQASAPETPEGQRVAARVSAALAERGPIDADASSRRASIELSIPDGTKRLVGFVLPLRLRGTSAGYLALAGGSVGDLDTQVADRAARILSIELAKQRAVTEAQLRLQGDLYDDLLTGNFPNEEAMLTRARWVGHDLTRPHVVVALGLSDDWRAANAQSRRFHAADLLRSSVLRDRSDVLTREHLGTVMVAISQTSESTRESNVMLAEGLRGTLSDPSSGRVATAGVGRAYAGVQGIERATHEAQQALEIARDLGNAGRTLHFEDLGILRLLFQLRDNAELVSFFNDLIGKLQAHDERHNTDLVNSLEAFFECNGNHVRTAQRLHLHRNTLLYRLERARQVLEVDFDDAETRLALQVALKIGRVIGRRPTT